MKYNPWKSVSFYLFLVFATLCLAILFCSGCISDTTNVTVILIDSEVSPVVAPEITGVSK